MMIDDDLLTDLTRRYGTPLYVYDIDEIARAATKLVSDLPAGAGLYYSVKANPHPDVVGALHQLNLRLELSSLGEIRLAEELSAVAGAIFTGPGKSETEYTWAIEHGIRKFSVESLRDRQELDRAADRTRTNVKCLVRINAGVRSAVGMRMTGKASQFGVDTDVIARESALLRSSRHTRMHGLHMYPATNIASEADLIASLTSTIEIAGELSSKYGFDLGEVDVGGGFSAPLGVGGGEPPYPRLRTQISVQLDTHLPGWSAGAPHISFESGRRLVGTCGTLVATVRDIKQSHDRWFGVLDTGINHFGGMSGLGRVVPPALQPTRIASSRRADTVTPFTGSLVGPLCTPADVVAPNVTLADLRTGDLVAVPNVGAYGLSAGLVAFLSHPAPVEVVVRGEEVVSASRYTMTREPVSTTEVAS